MDRSALAWFMVSVVSLSYRLVTWQLLSLCGIGVSTRNLRPTPGVALLGAAASRNFRPSCPLGDTIQGAFVNRISAAKARPGPRRTNVQTRAASFGKECRHGLNPGT